MVVMGRVADAYGIQGWLKIQPYTAQPGSLVDYKTWWLGDEQRGWHEVDVLQSALHGGKTVVAQLIGCVDRTAAERHKGQLVAIPRNRLPQPDDGEYYWSDLMGLAVVNEQGETLGQVEDLLDTGANQVLCVRHGSGKEVLIPFIESAIRRVSLAEQVIRVDWQADY